MQTLPLDREATGFGFTSVHVDLNSSSVNYESTGSLSVTL
jgi:hypothetical protein